MNALSSSATKKRKKSETKPQAQINKCNNEKRRREQENIYIEELAELISANFADMSSLSVKPDKCAILQETVNQIRSIKQRESAVQSSDPVQQGEVSSSRPTILSNEVFGPLLLEALEGFLFVVNGEGKVEQVTENVTTYIKFTKEDILGKSIYNFIHPGDHARFSGSLLPMSIGWPNESSNRSRSFSIRLLVKPADEHDESVEEKQQRLSSYELMHVLSAQLGDQVSVPDEDGGSAASDAGPCLLCVASRISYRDKANAGVEQFTTKLDTGGKVIGVDTSGVSAAYSTHLNKDLMHRALDELVPAQDAHKLAQHLRDTLAAGQATSQFYRLQLAHDKFIQVQTKSKLFKTNSHAAGESDFIMATHSIIGESDSLGSSDQCGGNNNNSVGGPLMTSVANGARSADGAATASPSGASLLAPNATPYTPFAIDGDLLTFEMFPSSTWELDAPGCWPPEPRPDSRQSVTPVSTPTPRPPSAPAFSPSPPAPATPARPYGDGFAFSPLAERGYDADAAKDEAAIVADSNRLRNLLTKGPPPQAAESGGDSDRNKNRILKGLLNQQDDDDRGDKMSPRGLMGRSAMAGPSELPKNNAAPGRNNMLLELLNDKSDDDDLEARAGVKKKSELLQQLLKPEKIDENDERKGDARANDDTLLKSLGFDNSPSPPDRATRKRSSDGEDLNPMKKTPDVKLPQVTSTGSKLCERNKMLVSLLAKQTPNHQPIPPIPASILHATPQEKLPKVIDTNLTKSVNSRVSSAQQNAQQQQQQQQQQMNIGRVRMVGRPPTNYLNSMLSPNNGLPKDARLQSQVYNTSPATSTTDNNNSWSDNNNVQMSNDPILSDLLDQVIDIVPEELMQLLDSTSDQQPSSYQTTSEMSEKMAINNIQKSLMQVENCMKSSSSMVLPPYSTATALNSQSGQRVGFPPPPNYPQQGYKMGQRVSRPNANYQIAGSTGAANPQQLLIQQQRKAMAQQQERRRLLQQQRQQHLLIPPNATAAEINSGIQNIDSLLNNTVAPNVSLQRSTSVPEPQSSPNYGLTSQQAQRVGGQQPYSPHSQLASPIQQQNYPQTTIGNFQQTAARMSPNSAFGQQLSPRQNYSQGNQQNANWNSQRLTMQNPMLNAQLTRAPQQQRSISSPGTRQSPFAADAFPPPTSPNSAFNQSQYLQRMQRANSTPTATTHLPGGLGSPRPYGREHHPHPYPQIPPQSHHSMMYQDAQYCYDQTGLHMYNGADRGRPPPHLHAGVSGGGPTSEFVRQELRAVVGARTGQSQPQPNRQPSQLLTQQQQVADLEALGLSFDSGASDSPKLWGAIGTDMGSLSPQPATSRSTMEEVRQGDHKSSLLQKLLSE